jgi:GT2 family glycosyltransferase
VPSLACIIPVVGNIDGLEPTLVSVLERRPEQCEVVVVANVPYHDPYDLQGEIQILQADAGAGLVDCINLGIAATQAPIVHTLATGIEATDQWIEAALAHFEDPRVAAVTPVICERADSNRILGAGTVAGRRGQKIVSETISEDRDSVDGPFLQAAFYRRSALAAFGGGLSTAVGDELADVDLTLSLRRAGWRIVLEPNSRVAASTIDRLAAGGFYSGLYAERLYRRHRLGVAQTGTLARMGSGAISRSPAQIAGRLAAMCQVGDFKKHREAMAAAKQDAAAATAEWQAMQNALETASDKQRRVDSAHQLSEPNNGSGAPRRTYRRQRQS